MYIRLAALALAATTFVASGCGGSSKAASTAATTAAATTGATTTAATTTAGSPQTPITLATGKPLSRARWIAAGDAICAHENRQMAAISVVSTRELAQALPQAAAFERAEAVAFSKLVPPAAMAHDWAQIVSLTQLFSEDSIKLAQYAQAKNAAAGRPLVTEANKVQAQAAKIAKRDGFKRCSRV